MSTRIGVLTGGGDVPGLNPCIKALVYGAVDRGDEVIGLRRGWAGLLDYDLDAAEPNTAQRLSKEDVRTVDRTGGTFLHTSRTNPGKVRSRDVPEFLKGQGQGESDGPFDFTNHCLAVIDRLGLDWLVPIGGDDTLSYGERLSPRRRCPSSLFPKTMDNDVFGTDYCIGFSTAVTRSVQFINQLRTSAGSHERIVVVELFGAQLRRDVAARRLPGGSRSGLDLRGPVRSAVAGPLRGGGQGCQPFQLRHGHGQRRRPHDRRFRGGTRRTGRLWPSQARRDSLRK